MSKSSVGHPRSASYNSTEDEVDIDEEPVDTGLIRCICSSSEDDGFTIQCERCLVWQHAFCVRISQNNIPEHYLCDQCERKSSTPWRQQLEQFSKAVENDVRTVLDKKLRHEFRETSSDKQHFRDIHNRIGDDDDYKPGVANRRPLPKKNPVGRPPKRPKLSKKIAVSKRSLQELHGDDRLVRRTARLHSQKRSFERISDNVIRSKHVKQVFKDAHERWHKSKEKVSGLVGDECLKSSKRGTVRPVTAQWRSGMTERQGLFADEELERNQLVAQVNGDIVLKSEYKFDPANDFCVLGTPCAHVFFYPTLDLCIDARSRGNDARHVRRSCHPNAELRAIVSAHDHQQIRLGLFARRHVHAGDELTIGYNWQRGHISWKKNLEWHDCGATDGHQVIDEEDQRANRSALVQMLARFDAEFGVCACHDAHLCFIEHLKALLSGSDAPPLANYKVSPNNGHLSRADAQSSRQTIVDNLAKPSPVEPGEDGIVIDVVSTSPLVRSPVISTPKRVSDDTEEELDVDGDIDVGDESMDYVPAPERQPGSERSLSRASSQSSFSGPDHARNGKRPRPSTSAPGPLKRHSVGSHDDVHGPTKLPCKKAWMRHFMQQVTPAPSTNDSKDEHSEQQHQEQPAVKEETSHTKPSPSPTPPLPATMEQPVATAVVEMEDDGELSDASSASTIPINEQDDDRMNGLQEEVPSQQQQADDGEALSSETDEQNKPTKVKLSLQEYLARRGTSGQKVGNGDKSQDCGASTEEHRWMTATNQVEVTMEVRPHEAQH